MSLTNMEKQKLADIARAFSEEEIRFILMQIPEQFMLDELNRRENIMSTALNDVCDVLQNMKNTMTLDEMHSMINDVKSILK